MKTRLAAVAAVLLLALTGCAGNPGNAGDERSAPTTAEPPVAAPATVAPTGSEEVDSEAYFLESSLVAQIELSDDEKLAAGYYACEQVAAGNLKVVALNGVDPAINRAYVADSTVILCSDLAETYAAYRDSAGG